MGRTTKGEVAALFDSDERTVRRWETDGCSGALAILLHLIDEGRLTLERIRAAKLIMARRLRQALAREQGRIG